MRVRKIFLYTALTVVFGLILLLFFPASVVAQTGSLPIEEAKKEGRVLLYHSPGVEDIKKLMDRFQQIYPMIAPTQYRATVASLFTRIVTEARAKVYKPDVIISNAIYGYLLKKEGLLSEYDIPERRSIRDEVRLAGGFYDPLFINTHVIAYNTRLVSPKDAPKTYQDLLQPRWKGKICIVDKLYEWYIGLQKYMGAEEADQYLKALSNQQVILRANRTLVAQLLAAGDFSIAVGVYGHEVEKLKADNAHIEWVGAPPVVTNVPAISIAAHAPHPNAAKLFVNFALSREGQTIVRNFRRIPVSKDVKPLVPGLIEGLTLVSVPPESVEKFDEVAKKFRSFFK